MKQPRVLQLAVLTLLGTGLLFSCKKDQIQDMHDQKPDAAVMQNNNDMVQTPYGVVPASLVVTVDNKTTAEISNGHLHLVDLPTGRVIKDLGTLSKEELSSADPYAYAAKLELKYGIKNSFPVGKKAASNAIHRNEAPMGTSPGANYPGYYLGATMSNIQSFSTKWVVPNKPIDTAGLITTFLWNGLDGGAIQPVMQWEQGQGPNYTIANWYFVGGHYFHGTFVPVSVGEQLEGLITYISHTDTSWTYKESFVGHPTADVTIVRPTEATGLSECWEAYTKILSKWPNQPYAAMTDIHLTLRSGTAPDTIHWYGINDGPVTTPTGYNSVVVNSSSSDGEVRFYFGDGTGITPDSTYKIISAVNGTSVLDVTGGGTGNGTKVELWSNNVPTSTNQEWKLVSVGDGYYKLLPVNALSKAMDVKSASSAAGTQVQIYSDNGTDAQKWKITPVGNGYCSLSPACAPSSSLDIQSANPANGTKVEIWPSNGGSAQQFKFVMQ